MKAKTIIKGFGATYIDESVAEPAKPEITTEESLVALIFDRYAPADNFPESTDQKSTLDLIDEMESSCEVSKYNIKKAMEQFGFKLHYTGSEFVWLLKERSNK
jgi:hypothetical protein